MGIVDKIKQLLGGPSQAAAPSEHAEPAPDPRVHPGDDPVPAPVDTEPPHGDPVREEPTAS
jgi:hypothetical protein